MRLKQAAIAAFITALVLGVTACNPKEVGPDVVPGEEPQDKNTVLVLWTYEPEPVHIRLSVHNAEGIPLLSNKGEPLDNYETAVATSLENVRPGESAEWEIEFYHPGAISGSIKVDTVIGLKVGCRLFSQDKAGVRTSLGQDQSGKGPRFTCLFARS